MVGTGADVPGLARGPCHVAPWSPALGCFKLVAGQGWDLIKAEAEMDDLPWDNIETVFVPWKSKSPPLPCFDCSI